MANENRFSLLQLEKDVLKYVEYRKKYQYFDNKLGEVSSQEEKAMNKENRDYWYNKYIKKMAYLERSYRRTNVYTDYHRQLENPNYNNGSYAEHLPSAPSYEINSSIAEPMPSAPSHEIVASAFNPTPLAEVVNVNFDADPKSIITAQAIPE